MQSFSMAECFIAGFSLLAIHEGFGSSPHLLLELLDLNPYIDYMYKSSIEPDRSYRRSTNLNVYCHCSNL